MKKTIRCIMCGRMLKKENTKELCRCCYIKLWKKLNYHTKKPKGFKDYKEVDPEKKETFKYLYY